MRLAVVHFTAPPPSSHRDLVAGIQVGIEVPASVVTEEERLRLEKERQNLLAQIERVQQLLADEQFTSKAPEKVVQQNRQRLLEMRERLQRIDGGLR